MRFSSYKDIIEAPKIKYGWRDHAHLGVFVTLTNVCTKSQGKGQFWGFSPCWQCIVQQSIWDPYENGRTDRDAVWVDDFGGPLVLVPCVRWGTRSPNGTWQFFRGNVAAHCYVMGHSTVCCAKTVEPIDMLFWTKTRVGPLTMY